MKKILIVFLLLFMVYDIRAEYITQDVNGGCASNFLFDISGEAYLLPQFTINTYNCAAGYYLPADTLGCMACPALGYSCPGGAYEYNQYKDQGISYKKPVSENVTNGCKGDLLFPENGNVNLEPIFIKKELVCSAGYYLPAGVDACTLCPVNSACSGGTYIFNETTAQGIVACTSGTFAPTGSAVCYPHILHVGNDVIYLKSTKQTTPSLNIRIGNDIFYANMTTTRTRMNKDSSHYFHVQWDNNDYYVCDDTTYQE